MKYFRKFAFVVVLSMLLAVVAPANAFASETAHLYAYSSNNLSGQEEYASSKLGSFINAYGHTNDASSLILGKGIKIYDPSDLEKVLFPIWKNNEIIATFLVMTVGDGSYAGSYSEMYAKQLNELKNITSFLNPIFLVASDDGFFASVSGKFYDLNGEIIMCASQGDSYFIEPSQEFNDITSVIIDASESLQYDEYYQARIATSYTLPFTAKYIQTGNACYSYALGTILWNMGYTAYTPTDIYNYMNCASSATNEDMSDYLASKGLRCTYQESGYLPFSSVSSIIFQNKSYIFASGKRLDGQTAHAFVLFGYTDDGVTQTYSLWNPWYSTAQVIDASTRLIPTQDTRVYKWDRGYLYGIR